jgi:kynurenine formamidase
VFRAIIDLTHTVSADAPSWESASSAVTAEVVATHDREGYYVRRISLDEHTSTHLDAPAHMARTGWTVDQIPAERLVGPLVVLDISGQARQDADYRLRNEDITLWEEEHGMIPAGAIVIAYTGWASLWQTPQAYRNADAEGALHFPGYSLEAAKLLVDSRSAVGLGIDTLSVDFGASRDYEVHRFCASRGVYHLENVANPGQVPPAGAMAVVLPMKMENGSGAPVRIVALVEQRQKTLSP